MPDVFLGGSFCHAPLRDLFFDEARAAKPAALSGWGLDWIRDNSFLALALDPQTSAEGYVVSDLSPVEMRRVSFFAGSLGLDLLPAAAIVDGVPHEVLVPAMPERNGPIPLSSAFDDWAKRYGEAVVQTAKDILSLEDQCPPDAILARYGPMLVRGASRARAASDAAPALLRTEMGPDAVQIEAKRQVYARFFAVEEFDLRFRRFDGRLSDTINRATFVSGDAVTVLPYDPVRDRVLLVEQFRAGPFARGDRNAWSLEAIAGRIDPGETPEDCAHREAEEEAGLRLGALFKVAAYYPSPGAKTEFLYSYVGFADLPDGAAGVHGVEDEAEDIRGHIIAFDQLMALVGTGEVGNGPLVLTALWLERERDRLRATAMR